ncbi:vitellogenin-2-like [Contarinia nasturtii]|uniref:vitellogenin-2-like n=1 Tax=Contarinia nasturtii TaxID=265458 RepID=UPI0012D4A86C|nr:vitellogenin-2-like [Contarinia nasturtii]
MKYFLATLFVVALYSSGTDCAFDWGHIGKSSVDIVSGVVQKIPDAIPSPKELFETGKNLIAGYPFEYAFSAINTFCAAALSTKTIQPLITPNIDHMNFVLKIENLSIAVPLKEPKQLWTLPEFNPKLPLILMISGWTTNFNDSANPTVDKIYEAYRCRGNVNFVTIDPAAFVDTLYTWSAFNTEEIGNLIAISLEILIKNYPIQNIHLIGHSLGSHICGSAGRNLFYKTGKLLPKITALDPANPCFNPGETLTGLSRGDAEFVLVVHSNSGGLGKRDPLGDVDWFPNGVQPLPPGCFSITCAHQRAVDYFAESTYPGNEYNFMGVKCSSLFALTTNSCPGESFPMGYATPSYLKGNFFLKTNAESPYGLNATRNFQPICNNSLNKIDAL